VPEGRASPSRPQCCLQIDHTDNSLPKGAALPAAANEHIPELVSHSIHRPERSGGDDVGSLSAVAAECEVLVEQTRPDVRRRERVMLRLRRMKTLQKFASVHANIHNHFNLERHLVERQTYKERRSAALAE